MRNLCVFLLVILISSVVVAQTEKGQVVDSLKLVDTQIKNLRDSISFNNKMDSLFHRNPENKKYTSPYMMKNIVYSNELFFLIERSISLFEKKDQRAQFDAFKNAKKAEFEALKKDQQAEFDDFSDRKRKIFVKTIIFECKDTSFLEKELFIKKVSPSEFKRIVLKKCENCIFADTIIFRYNSHSWESDVIVKVHSNLTKLPLSFSAGQVGTTFNSLLMAIEENLSSIKYTMEAQEAEAVKGSPNYEYIK